MPLSEDVDLYEDYRRLVYRIVQSFKIDPYQDEDLVQVGMLGLTRAAKYYRPERDIKFSTYAWHSISRTIYTELNRRNRRDRLSTVDLLGNEPDRSPQRDREVGFDWDFVARNVRDVRTAYVLRRRYWEGDRLCDVAGTLNLTRERVRQIESKGLDDLRNRLTRRKNHGFNERRVSRRQGPDDDALLQALREMRAKDARKEVDVPPLREGPPKSERRVGGSPEDGRFSLLWGRRRVGVPQAIPVAR